MLAIDILSLNKFNEPPYIYDSEELVDLPHEGGIWDANLLVLGAVAGVAAAVFLESVTGLLSVGASNVAPALRELKVKIRKVTPTP